MAEGMIQNRPLDLEQCATVYGQLQARDVARFIRGQIDDRMGDVVGLDVRDRHCLHVRERLFHVGASRVGEILAKRLVQVSTPEGAEFPPPMPGAAFGDHQGFGVPIALSVQASAL